MRVELNDQGVVILHLTGQPVQFSSLVQPHDKLHTSRYSFPFTNYRAALLNIGLLEYHMILVNSPLL